MDHPWPVSTFRQERHHLTTFVDRVVDVIHLGNRVIVIRAPVKSGKREMVEYMTLALEDHSHYFLSSFHRIADNEQRAEMERYPIKVLSGMCDKQVEILEEAITSDLNSDKLIVVHLDECDYGAGKDQNMAKCWDLIKDNPAVTVILYSATPSEVHFSNGNSSTMKTLSEIVVTSNNSVFLPYEPPRGFCGPQVFLNHGLVKEALPFYEGNRLTNQGKEIFNEFLENIKINPIKNILIIRLCGTEGGKTREHKHLDKFIKNLDKIEELWLPDNKRLIVRAPNCSKKFKNNYKHFSLYFDDIDWSNKISWEDKFPIGKPTMIVLDQTSTRSTEWSCHDRVFAYHDFRRTITFSTISQAQERVNHYYNPSGGKYTEFQPIKVYGYVKAWKLSAGLIDYSEFLNVDWKSRKINNSNPPVYKIFSIKDTNARHPDYDGNYSKKEADEILESLGCSNKTTLSCRVNGNSYDVYKIDSRFYECDESTFVNVSSSAYPGIRFDNPFSKEGAHPGEDGKWKGYLRTYRVLDYEDVMADRRWGMMVSSRRRATVCYKDGHLGVCFRFVTGEIVQESDLKAVHSMYIGG